MAKDKDIKLTIENAEPQETPEAPVSSATPETSDAPDAPETPEATGDTKLKETLKKIKENVHEDDPRPTQNLTFRSILGGDILTAEMVRRHIWLFVFIVVLSSAYVAVRYQCQQDMIAIDRLNTELTDAKYKAAASASTLTEKCRESRVLDILKQNQDSLLHIADQPPYIINVPE